MRSLIFRHALLDTLKNEKALLLFLPVAFFLTEATFFLYQLPLEVFFYSQALLFFFALCLLLICFLKQYKKAKILYAVLQNPLTEWKLCDINQTFSEKDYYRIIQCLGEEISRREALRVADREQNADYYISWVHQIKTPISVMKLRLDELGDSALSIKAELFRIEQYVDMVLTYVRLGNDAGDLVIESYALDEIIREALRKFAPLFILQKLTLHYTPTDMRIITDKKWFSCILEQLLSNAVKYTPGGSITIAENNGVLFISDTGIGIAREDLPRIFEKGYTGKNGRAGHKSSGIGLYLCKKAADLLSLKIDCQSEIKKGTVFYVPLMNIKDR